MQVRTYNRPYRESGIDGSREKTIIEVQRVEAMVI